LPTNKFAADYNQSKSYGKLAFIGFYTETGCILSILSIQSAVSYGHVGNSAAVFPLQRLGFEVWPVNTVQFSNHAGYETCRGPAMAASDIANVVTGIEEMGLFSKCQAVLSGYLGSFENGEVIARTVEKIKKANPTALYCCDPVIGDSREGVYVGEGIVDFIREHLAPKADILTPNRFELERLTGESASSDQALIKSARSLVEKGAFIVAVTSLQGVTSEEIATMVVTDSSAWRITTPRLALRAKGTGDVFAALLLGHVLKGRQVEDALEQTCSALFHVIKETSKTDSEELLLITHQEAFSIPSHQFLIERLD